MQAGSRSAESAVEDQVDWRLNVCTNPYAEVRELTRPGSRRPLCPPPARTTHGAEMVVFRSNSNAVQLVINGQRPSSADDGGPYFLLRYEGTIVHVQVAVWRSGNALVLISEVNLR